MISVEIDGKIVNKRKPFVFIMASGEDIDSGMDSPVPDDTPVKKMAIEEEEDEVCIMRLRVSIFYVDWAITFFFSYYS